MTETVVGKRKEKTKETEPFRGKTKDARLTSVAARNATGGGGDATAPGKAHHQWVQLFIRIANYWRIAVKDKKRDLPTPGYLDPIEKLKDLFLLNNCLWLLTGV